MDQGWEIDEEHYLEHLMTNPLQLKKQTSQIIEKPEKQLNINAQQSPKSKMRFRTASMPKLEDSKPNSPSKKNEKPLIEKPLAQTSPVIVKTPIRQQKFQLYPQKISLRSIDDSSPSKLGRTLQMKQFNPTLKNGDTSHYIGMRGQSRSVKSASMSNLFQDKRRIEDFVFRLRPQRNASLLVDDVILRKLQK